MGGDIPCRLLGLIAMHSTLRKLKSFAAPVLLGVAGAAIVPLTLWLSGAPFSGLALALGGVYGLVSAILLGLWAIRQGVRPSMRLRETIRASLLDGDLSRRAAPDGMLAPVADEYNAMLSSFQGIVGRIVFNAEQVEETAKRLIEDAGNTVSGSEQQHTAAASVAQEATSMADGITRIAQNTEETTQIARAAMDQSSHGVTVVERVASEITRLVDSVEQASASVAALGQRSDAISSIVSTIHDIADQTNLLALNAAIEAARAGEQGRGFAVVADEVRKLAERTALSTREIGALISAIQDEIQHAIATINEGRDQAKTSASLASETAGALAAIKQGAENTLGQVTSISNTIAEQKGQAQHIARQAQDIIALSERNTEGARHTQDAAGRLNYLATNLAEVGNVFRLGKAGEAAHRLHTSMPDVVRKVSTDVSQALETALDRGLLSEEDLFDLTHTPIPNTRPEKYHTRSDQILDRVLPSVQEPALEQCHEATYVIAVDRKGYCPTHNKRFTQPLTGDAERDKVGNRTKRIFADPVGKRCGAHTQPFLIQTYRRDTGEIMHDISAPIYVRGRHWGGVRIGYVTEEN